MDTNELAGKYHDDMADNYDYVRENTPQWINEQRIVKEFLANLIGNKTVLDVPVGTGRFFEDYMDLSFKVTGIDASSSMLAKAKTKVTPSMSQSIDLYEGDIYSLEFEDNAFDLVVCMRFMDWVKGDAFHNAFSELSRVSKHTVIVSIPTFTPVSGKKLLSVSGFLRMLRQWKLRFYMMRTRSTAVIHKKHEIVRLIDKLGLKVVASKRIDSPSRKIWRRGVERDIYLLRKQAE